MPVTQRRRPRDRGACIALAAAELFCVRGFHNVALEDIAGVVGITGPAIYRHFPTKQAILAAAVEELAGAFATTVASAAPGGLPDVVGALVRFALDRRPVVRLYQWESRHLPAGERVRLAGRFADTVAVLRELVAGNRPSLSTRDVSVLVAAALSVVVSPSTHRATLARSTAERTVTDGALAVLATDLPPPGRRPAGPDRRLTLLPRRERLLAEAVRLFHERGYHAVSIAEIGAAAGITASSVYAHVTGKADLLAAAYHRATSRLELATAEALTGTTSPATALRRLAETYVRITFDQADLTAVYVSESENLRPADRHRLRVAQRRHVDTWVGLLGDLEPQRPAVLRFRVHAALNVVTDLARTGGRSVTEQRAVALVLALLDQRRNWS
ncbi:hypothetical protein BLA60_08495 [Actinophytocola xinjiangensis]|uniref:HTH tetR-type domain-containing protein n=1 Tax=Actinophytocola xinjiangensis TaxID=485602 RepID=A0A7Z1AYP9_9PSEU|nr:TetR/AcrR family transcriptional regulator [Actinophytocola xinjiangensis]OLF12054.1 hypothetical protein BLA60_08495 [Actinophytocola xinjiangensis]